MFLKLRLLFLGAAFFFGGSLFSWAQSPPAASKAWLRYLQTEHHLVRGSWSSIRTPFFFLSPDGRENPQAEWDKSFHAFRHQEKYPMDGVPTPVRCLFPARAELMEKLSGEKFPVEKCPDIDRWLDSLGTEKLAVIFAGAYSNNPASLFGHTFFRISSLKNEDKSDKLRSYSSGFLAATDPTDLQGVLVFKGLLGLYTGSFNVKPQYINAAIYNNSESRDLWEYSLKLTAEERRWAVLYLWELSHAGDMDYYFLDWNCSYRLVTFLEAVRPTLDLSSKTGFFVVPIDTVRLMDSANLIEKEVGFEPSLRKRLEKKLSLMTGDQRPLFRSGRSDLATVASLQDPLVLDALVDFWTAKNYEKSTQLSEEERKIFDLTFLQRSKTGAASFKIESEELRPAVRPDEGHSSSWLEAKAGNAPNYLSLSWRLGVHDLFSPTSGYDNSAVIEYLGFDLEHDLLSGQLLKARLMVIDVAALLPWSHEFAEFSWRVVSDFRGERTLENSSWKSWLNFQVGGGFTFELIKDRWILFALPQIHGILGTQNVDSIAGPEIWAGTRWEGQWFSLLLAGTRGDFQGKSLEEAQVRLSKMWRKDQMVFLEATRSRLPWMGAPQDRGQNGLRLYY